MSTKSVRLLAVGSIPEGRALIQGFLGELGDLFLAESQDLQIAGIAYNKRAAIQQLNSTQPDVLLIDLMLLGPRSTEIISYASAMLPDVKILAFCPGDPPHDRVILALQAGALGFVSKDAETAEVFAAIQKVLRGERYLPLEETYDVLQQAAPELIASARERRGNLVQALLALIPVVGITAAFTEYLWRKFWGQIGVRVTDLGTDASSRVTEFLITFLLLLGIFGALLFFPTWMKIIGSWIDDRPRLKTMITNAQEIRLKNWPIGRHLFGDWTARFVLVLLVLAITIPLDISGGKILTLFLGVVIGLILLAHVLGTSEILPEFLRLPREKVQQALAYIGGLALVLLMMLSAEVFLRGPDLRTDGLHGFLAPTILGLSARPALIHDLDEKRKPLGALYLGGNADLYVLYDPCEKVVRLIPVGSSRVKMIKEVQCPSPK